MQIIKVSDIEPLFQQAYRYHRLIALKELGIKWIDAPVMVMGESTMFKIMANENMDVWKIQPRILMNTVIAAKKFLDRVLKRYKTWESMNAAHGTLSGHFPKDPHRYGQLHNSKDGVGQKIISRFLGGNWTGWKVQHALSALKKDKEKKVSKPAWETFDRQSFQTGPILGFLKSEK